MRKLSRGGSTGHVQANEEDCEEQAEPVSVLLVLRESHVIIIPILNQRPLPFLPPTTPHDIAPLLLLLPTLHLASPYPPPCLSLYSPFLGWFFLGVKSASITGEIISTLISDSFRVDNLNLRLVMVLTVGKAGRVGKALGQKDQCY